MPCNCGKQPIVVPDNAEWGPLFWKLLHGFAERAGRSKVPILQTDEKLSWKVLLTTLPTALACPDCREHLTAYVLLHPIGIPDKYEDLRPYVRRWLYDLHEDVNRRLLKPSFPFEDLPKDTDLKQTFGILNIVIKKSIQGTSLSLLAWIKWSKHARLLVGMYT